MAAIRACVFDAYGTLFDVHSAVARHAADVGPDAQAVSALWRQKQLEYSWVRSLMGRHADFRQVTAEALDHALAVHGIARDTAPGGLRDRLMDAYFTLDAYPDVVPALERLKRAGLALAILSNGSHGMLEAAVASAGIGPLLDAVLSIDDVGIFKPDFRVYQLAVDRLGVPPEAIGFQSSNAWDAAGAAAFGFRVVWINRRGQPPEYGFAPPAHILEDLSGLPEVAANIG